MPRFAVLFALLAPLLRGQVEGVVVNRVTGAGIGAVAVTLYTGQGIRYETATDDSGVFRATGMRPGSYQVRYEKPRFKPFHEDPVSPFRVDSGSVVQLRLEMTPLVTLRGWVLTADGKPAQRAQVRIGAFNEFVDERGEFEFDQLQPGSYTMLAEPGPTRPSSDERIEPVQTSFPRRIVVRGDADLAGFEIRLQSVPVHRVRGVVLDETGRPAAGTVRLLAVIQRERQVLGSDSFLIAGPEPGDGLLQASTTTADDGSFEFPSVPSGDWRVAVDAAGRLGEGIVSVGRNDVDHLEIRVTRQALFTMNVAVDWGSAPADASLLSALPGRKVILADGNVRLENVRPGRYRVQPLAERGYYPASALFGGTEVLGQTISLSDGSPQLRIVYKAATGGVTGTAPTRATVVLLPKQGSGYGRVTRCDSAGVFSIDGVAPGEYFLSAFEAFDRSFLTDPELWTQIAANGTRVTVGTGQVAGVELKTVRWP